MSEHILNHLSGVDANLGGVIRAVGPYGLVKEGETQPFTALARAIAHQQLHAAAARNILGRLIANVGGGVFPTPEIVVAAPDEALRAVGFSGSKIAALRDLAAKTIEGVVPDRATLEKLEDAEIISRLTAVRGIGRWTVEMLLMFHLGRPDILPIDDFGVRMGFQLTNGLRKMPPPKVLAIYGERWGPHRSAAAWYFWRAVELKKAGKLPDPVEQIRLPRIVKLRRRKSAVKAKSRPTQRPKATARRGKAASKPVEAAGRRGKAASKPVKAAGKRVKLAGKRVKVGRSARSRREGSPNRKSGP
jgi:DNA-3-methyladenine glycosylase II